MIFDKIVLLTIFLYITLNLRKVENFIDGGYKFEAFTEEKFEAFTEEKGTRDARLSYTLGKVVAVFILLIFFTVDRVDLPTYSHNGEHWIQTGQHGDKVVEGATRLSFYKNFKSKNWLDRVGLAAPRNGWSPVVSENREYKEWFTEQLIPYTFFFLGLAILILLSMGLDRKEVWEAAEPIENIANEIITLISIYVILNFAQKGTPKDIKLAAGRVEEALKRGNMAAEATDRALRASARAEAGRARARGRARATLLSAQRQKTANAGDGEGSAQASATGAATVETEATAAAEATAATAAATAAEATAATAAATAAAEADATAAKAAQAALAKKTKVPRRRASTSSVTGGARTRLFAHSPLHSKSSTTVAADNEEMFFDSISDAKTRISDAKTRGKIDSRGP